MSFAKGKDIYLQIFSGKTVFQFEKLALKKFGKFLMIIRDLKTYEMLCAIWYHLYNLKNMKNTRAGVLLLVNNIPAWVFSTFLNCTHGTNSGKTSHILIYKTCTLAHISDTEIIWNLLKFRATTSSIMFKLIYFVK